MIKTEYRSSWKVPIILATFQRNLHFLHRFFKNIKISYFIKICPVGTELFREDGWTGRQTWWS